MTWYEPDGLRFECTLCGACCSGGEGMVLFSPEEGEAIARRLGIPVAEFLARYTRMVDVSGSAGGRTVKVRSLNEVPKPEGLDCVFLDRTTMPGKAICSLYEDRPTQCRTFPFWPEHVDTPKGWKRLSKHCEGIGRGNFVPVEAIRVDRDRQRAVDLSR
ncbi:MAG: YkgJ family cysteine cluster protein [Phycisphaerales bacterium]